MAGKRLAAVQLELSPEQKTILQDLTGESRSSIVIGVRTDKPRGKIPQELTDQGDEELVRLLHELQGNLMPALEKGDYDVSFEGVIAAAVVW